MKIRVFIFDEGRYCLKLLISRRGHCLARPWRRLIQTYHGPEHVAFYNTGEEQVEMHLRANRPILVEICQLDLQVRMNEGETINTEICGKFSRQSAATMAEEAGLRVNRWFTAPQGWFSLAELVRMDRD